MRFVFGAQGAGVIMVDGVDDDAAASPCERNLSHWPGNRSPACYLGDTSTEMALALLRATDGERDEYLRGITTVTNNHFDTDGLLSAFALLAPRRALDLSERLVQAAQAGDFGRITSPYAMRLEMIVSGHEASPASPLRAALDALPSATARRALLYDALLPELEHLLGQDEELSGHRNLWQEPWSHLQEELALFERGHVKVTDLAPAGLAVMKTPRRLSTTAIFARTARDRALQLWPDSDGEGVGYELVFHAYTWFVTRHPWGLPRVDLAAQANRLTSLEQAARSAHGRWVFSGVDALWPRLMPEAAGNRRGTSALALPVVLGVVAPALQAATLRTP